MYGLELMIANEENTFNINDLWVSAAVAQDTAVFDDEDEEQAEELDDNAITTPSASQATPLSERGNSVSRARGRIVSGMSMTRHRLSVSQGGRRFSTSSGTLPAIFSNTGLAHQPALIAAHEESPGIASPGVSGDPFFASPAVARHVGGQLSAIEERPQSQHHGERSPLVAPTAEIQEKPVTGWRALPLLMISQVSRLSTDWS